MTRHLAALLAFCIVYLPLPVSAQDYPPEVERALDAVGERKAECLSDYQGADAGDFTLDSLCEYRAWQPLAVRWPDTATKGLKAERRANQLAAQLNESRARVGQLEARNEQLAERVGQLGGRPSKLRAAAFGVGAGVVALGVGIVVGLVVAR